MHFIPQTANFWAPIPAISHFVRFVFNPEKMEKAMNIPTRYSMDCESFR